MFCSKCGNKLADGSKFCPGCGNKTGGVVSEEKQTPASNNDIPPKNEPVLQQEDEAGANEFEFTKRRELMAYNLGENVAKVVLGETGLTVSIQWVWGKPKGQPKTYSVEYSAIQTAQIKAGFSISSLICCIPFVVIGCFTAGIGLIGIPLMLFFGFGSWITIVNKNGSKISFMSSKLEGNTREEWCKKMEEKGVTVQRGKK